MAQISIQNLPQQLYEWLKARAAEHDLSLEEEAIRCIGLYFDRERRQPQNILKEVQQLRQSIKAVYLTDQALQLARADGRE